MLSLIVALASNGVIGRDGELPWHLPDDLAHFKRTTLGKPVIMGRRTFASIGRPLPRRENLVLSRNPHFAAEGVRVVCSLDEALELCANAPERVVIGGAALYAEALPRADRLYLTRILAEVPGDVCFPEFEASAWREVDRAEHAADARHGYPFRALILDRISTK